MCLALLTKVPPFPDHSALGARCYPLHCMDNTAEEHILLDPELGRSGLVHAVVLLVVGTEK